MMKSSLVSCSTALLAAGGVLLAPQQSAAQGPSAAPLPPLTITRPAPTNYATRYDCHAVIKTSQFGPEWGCITVGGRHQPIPIQYAKQNNGHFNQTLSFHWQGYTYYASYNLCTTILNDERRSRIATCEPDTLTINGRNVSLYVDVPYEPAPSYDTAPPPSNWWYQWSSPPAAVYYPPRARQHRGYTPPPVVENPPRQPRPPHQRPTPPVITKPDWGPNHPGRRIERQRPSHPSIQRPPSVAPAARPDLGSRHPALQQRSGGDFRGRGSTSMRPLAPLPRAAPSFSPPPTRAAPPSPPRSAPPPPPARGGGDRRR